MRGVAIRLDALSTPKMGENPHEKMASEEDITTAEISSVQGNAEPVRRVRTHEGSLVLDPPKGWIQQRYIVASMAFLGNLCCYALRVDLSVALVAMVNQTAILQSNSIANASGLDVECPRPAMTNDTKVDADGEFSWSPATQGLILGSFFWGYISTQLAGGWLAQRWSAKWVYGIGTLSAGLLTLLTPIAARLGTITLIIVRVLEGVGQGVTFPSLQCLLTKWSPPFERTQISTVAFVGMHMGTVVTMPITGILSGSEWTGGWPSAFYFFGVVTTIWFVFWCFLVHDSPDDAKWISDEEKIYIQKSLGNTTTSKNADGRVTPWVDIFASIRLWTILVAHVASNWGFYTLLTSLPQYMAQVLHFNIKQNAALSALPYLAYVVFGTTLSFMADAIRRRGWLSTTVVRKIANTLSMVLPATLLILTGFVGCDRMLAVACVTLSVMCSSFNLCGYLVNHMDIAPRFTGILVGITSTAATVPGMLGPYIVGLLTNDQPTRGQWQIVFYIAGSIYAFGAIFYLAFGTGMRQSWNDHGELTTEFVHRVRSLSGTSNVYSNMEDNKVE